jgi:hypothetical protein
MEWLEFNRWSQQAEAALCAVATTKSSRKLAQASSGSRVAELTRRMGPLLASHPPSDPWGHDFGRQ